MLSISGEDIRYSTLNRRTYIILSNLGITLTHRFISFKVKAKSDVHFALISGNTEYEQLYEIVIGGWTNTKSVIRTVKQGAHVSLKKGTFLDKGIFKVFWISWNDNTINVGRGLEAASGTIFLKWTNPTGLRPIRNAGFYTAFGSTGEWIFYKQELTTAITTHTEKTIGLTSQKTTDITSKITTDRTAQMTTDRTSQMTTDRTTLMTTDRTSSKMTTDRTSSKMTTDRTTLMTTDRTSSKMTIDRSFQPTTIPSCLCPCSKMGKWSNLQSQNLTKEELAVLLADEIEAIKKELLVERKSSSKYIRKITSAPDDRKSSKSIGFGAIFFLCIPLALIVLSDILTLYLYITRR
ncbi:Hypothetical predicted protein [Mytilus galloprovincialis]|uniref:Farnesoic acid O-methyl transferase domain-containing protein n=1 Tax=Mytilus galloprovincialis TaxID=29158 RepID=A0A8B6DWR3_MYTGA|nr:Hypothetical predicted protein [Mytilus galloprovincialis]